MVPSPHLEPIPAATPPAPGRDSLSDLSQLVTPRLDMPRRLVLVRHGESEANVINRAIKRGLISEYPQEYLRTPDREIRLSDDGVIQAGVTGAWLAKQYPEGFPVFFTSNHARAMETAGHLARSAGWDTSRVRLDPLLGERNWGIFTDESPERRAALLELRHRDPLHTPMPDGESLLFTRVRSRILLERCNREHSGKDILVITHGEYIEAILSEISHFYSEQHIHFFNSPEGDLKNCQVIELSAQNPFSGEWDGKFRWIRSSAPAFEELGGWHDLPRAAFTASQLLEIVEQYPHLADDIRSVPQQLHLQTPPA